MPQSTPSTYQDRSEGVLSGTSDKKKSNRVKASLKLASQEPVWGSVTVENCLLSMEW